MCRNQLRYFFLSLPRKLRRAWHVRIRNLADVRCTSKKRLMRGALLRIVYILAAGIVFCLFSPARSVAQTVFDDMPEPGSSEDYHGDWRELGGNPFDIPGEEGENAAAADTTKNKRKIRKPLESYFFDDSVRMQPNFVWNISTFRNRIEMSRIDTLLNQLQFDFPFQRKGVGDAHQGPLGGASIPFSYFDRPQYQDFSFASGYNAYYVHPETAPFYNVKSPFTQFQYFMAGQKIKAEENFEIRHAQNISPSTGFNVDYKSRGTKGQYNWQKMRDKNLSVAFSHTGKKYTVHAGYIYNAVLNQENGGITDDRLVTDTVIDLSQAIPTRLNDAQNTIKNNTYYVVQSYGIPLRRLTDDDFSIADRSSVFVGHAFEYHRWWRKYTDTRAESEGFYDNWYISPGSTNDSIFESRLTNRVFVQLQPWDRNGVIGTLDAGVGMDMHLFYMYDPNYLITGRKNEQKENSYYVYGAIDGSISRYFDWGGNIMFHPTGYKSGDLQFGANASMSAFIKGRPITLSGEFSIDRRLPDYWSQRFFSNHYAWSNSFDKENETRFEVKLDIPAIRLEAKVMHSVTGDKIYYNADAVPVQHDGNVNVTGVYASKGFRIPVGLSAFHFDHRVLLQWSTSQEVIPVPQVAAVASYYFEFNIVKNVLRCQFGVDGRYNTEYYAQGWNPATARFYNQREKEIGDYIKADLFLNAKWKRMRIFLKLEHANEDMFGSRNYFTVPHYPQNRRIFKYGFSWSFYD